MDNRRMCGIGSVVTEARRLISDDKIVKRSSFPTMKIVKMEVPSLGDLMEDSKCNEDVLLP